MRKSHITWGLALSALLFSPSCTKDFVEINDNPNQAVSVPTSYLFSQAQSNMMDLIWDEWWNGRFGLVYSQYWSQIAYTEESRFRPRVNITNTYWSLFYNNMMDLQEIIRLNTDEATRDVISASGSNNNQIAVARILKAYTFHMLTDVWGAIPYAEALQPFDFSFPNYTPQSEIYASLLTELDEAQAQIELDGAPVAGDIIYAGDMAMWKKFANSLRMRVALRASRVDGGYAAKVQAAYDAGAFGAYTEDANFQFDAASPGFSPLFETFQPRRDFSVSETLVEMLKGLEDPRLEIYCLPVVDTTGHGQTYRGTPYGMESGAATTYSGADGVLVSAPRSSITPAEVAPLMTYAEVCFIMSEINSFDQTWYENGIRASMNAWGITDAAAIDAYIAAAPAASAESVATQKWIHLYMNGLQGWFEWRRTGYPDLVAPVDGSLALEVPADGTVRYIPSRLPYPTDEQLLNGAAYKAAVSSQGVDDLATRVWWDTRN